MFCTTSKANLDMKIDSDLVSYVFAMELSDDSNNKAQVNDGSLVSFTANLTPQQTSDVQSSILLAQLAANKKYDRTSDTEKWYNFYQEVLSTVGWVMQDMRFVKYDSKQTTVEIPNFILEVVSGLVSDWANGDGVTKMVEDALNVLRIKSNERGLEIFGTTSNSFKGANFQILPCDVIKGQITTAFIGCSVSGTSTEVKYLYETYSSSKLDIYYDAQVMTLDEAVYSKIRSAVIQKLADNGRNKIWNYSL